ncbi:alpha/beta hydrolase [Geodermatophilus sp. DSM 45219]|uniref:alpha/beta hydrolase n=1 Tax=Geodermatophilus sp. DSM 45219 TaxID=1881103 RepID=UPI0015A47A68|nr:alpha/beta hydrolase [Geodermatophilus sp. DSM 45219]
MRALAVLLLLTGVLLGCAPVAPTEPPRRSPIAASSLEPTACPVPAPDGTRVECGRLTVPESRQRPDGRSLRLLVAVAPSLTPPSLPPLLVTAGGPGTSSTGLLGLAGSGYAQGRDVVVLEQRGTRESEPSLDCPEVEQALLASVTTADPVAEETAREVTAARACADRLRAEGVDLAAYTTTENAADVADLRRALGYAEWDLWGLSYSTRLVLTVLRDHPEGVRRVVLDSVVPPDVARYDGQVSSLRAAYERLVDDCAARPACARGWPGLDTALVDAAARLDARPLDVDAVSPDTGEPVRLRMTGDDLVSVVFDALYDPSTIRYVPLLVDRLGAGDAAAAAPVADAALEELSRRSLGLYYSVQCAEEAPFTTPGAAGEDAGALPGRAATHLLWLGSDLDVCRGWPVPPRPEAAVPVVTDVPVLVLAGRYDPVTPPAWGRQLAASLPTATFVEVPGQGHTPSLQGDCAPGIVIDFLADPRGEPDTSCLAGLAPPDVVVPDDVHLTGAVYRLAGEAERGPGPGLVLLGTASAGLLLGTAGLAWQLLRRRPGRRAAPVLALAAGVVDLAAVGVLVALVLDTAARDALLLGFGLPSVAGGVLLLPVLAALLAAGALVLLARRPTGQRRAERVPAAVVAISALGLLGVLAGVGLLP